MGRVYFFLLLIGLACTACAQIGPIELDPSSINPKAKKIKGEHLAYETPLARNGKLLVTVGGTGSKPLNFRALQQFATTMGYDIVALDYPNEVSTVKCRLSQDLNCFDHFHQEIVQGKEVSDLCTVDVNNSLEQRLQDVLKYLTTTNTSGRWREYYFQGQIQWSKLVLVGHSQGSGHVAFLGKLHKVDRVILIAGPQDSFDPLPAPWLLQAGATTKDRYFALLHKDDFYKASLQLSAFAALIESAGLTLDPLQSQQVIISDKPAKDAHNELIQKQFVNEWETFLKPR